MEEDIFTAPDAVRLWLQGNAVLFLEVSPRPDTCDSL